jgi:transcriptional regulator with XRE-family HTH domain
MADARVFFGRALACERIERGMKRAELAQRAGLSYPFIAEIENGKKTPSGESLARLAMVLGVAPSHLLRRAEHIEKEYGQ